MMSSTKFLLMCSLFCYIYFDGVPVSEGAPKGPVDSALDLVDFAQGKTTATTAATTKKRRKTTTDSDDISSTPAYSDTTIITEPSRRKKKQKWPEWTDSDETESKKFQAQYTRPPRTTTTTLRTTTKYDWSKVRFSDEKY